MGISIAKAGILDTIQDTGRFRFRKYGINPGGAMDRDSLRLINIILGNSENEAAVEMHFPAPEIAFGQPAVFALAGADFDATLDNTPISNWKIYYAKVGSLLKFHRRNSGNRCYLGVRGGFQIEKWLGSKNTNLMAQTGGIGGRKLAKDDRILFSRISERIDRIPDVEIASSLRPDFGVIRTVRITKGSEYRDLTALSEQLFFEGTYEIAKDSNRMGYRLDGSRLHLLSRKEMITSAVDHGTIQLPPDGKPLLLMADHQTTGGYPKIGHVINRDLSLVGQMSTGDKIRFEVISIDNAEKENEQFERDLSYLKMGVKFRQTDADN